MWNNIGNTKMHQESSSTTSVEMNANTCSTQISTDHLQSVLQSGQWTKIPHQKMNKNASCCVETCLFCRFCWVTLTCTHSFFVPRLVRAVVTVQSFVVIACIRLVAHLAHLSGAGLAAVTAVHEEAHTWRTGRGGPGTFAGPLAVLSSVVHFCSWGCDS